MFVMDFNRANSLQVAEYFTNYTGITYSEIDVADFEAQIATLTGLSVDVKGLGKTLVPNAEYIASSLAAELGEDVNNSYIVFGFNLESPSEGDFIFKVNVPGVTPENNQLIAADLSSGAERHYRENGNALEAVTNSLKSYLSSANSEVAYVFDLANISSKDKPEFTEPNNEQNPSNPYVSIQQDSWVITPSGVSLHLCSGSLAMFYPVNSTHAGCLYAFRPPPIDGKYTHPYIATKFVKAAEGYLNNFAGYSQRPDSGKDRKFWNYQVDNVCDCPPNLPNCHTPASEGEVQTIILGLRDECGEATTAKQISTPTTYIVKANDKSDISTNSDYQDLKKKFPQYPAYACVGEYLAFSDLFTTPTVIRTAFANEEAMFVDITNMNGFTNYSDYLCILDEYIDPVAIEEAYRHSYTAKLTQFTSDEKEGVYVLLRTQKGLYASVDYFSDDSEPTYFRYVKQNKQWFPVIRGTEKDFDPIFNMLIDAAKLLAATAFITANIAFGNAAGVFAVQYLALQGTRAMLTSVAATAAVDGVFGVAEAGTLFVFGNKEDAYTAAKIAAISIAAGSTIDIGIELFRLMKVGKHTIKFASEVDAAKFRLRNLDNGDDISAVIVDAQGRKRAVSINEFDWRLDGTGISDEMRDLIYEKLRNKNIELRNLLMNPDNEEVLRTLAKVSGVDNALAKELLNNPGLLKKLHEDVVASGFLLRTKFEADPALLDTWTVLKDFDDASVVALRRDPAALKKFAEDLGDGGLRPFIDEFGEDGVLAWKWLDDAFPNQSPCKIL